MPYCELFGARARCRTQLDGPESATHASGLFLDFIVVCGMTAPGVDPHIDVVAASRLANIRITGSNNNPDKSSSSLP